MFRNALERVADVSVIFQIGYYAPNLDERVSAYEQGGVRGWVAHRRTEQVRLYPGTKLDTAVFYVAHHNDVIPGFEMELIQPMTEPNYINKLRLLPGQIAHLAVNADKIDGDDLQIVKRFSTHAPTAIQKGEVRRGRKNITKYTIYRVEDFLPVKIVRTKENEDA